MHKECMIYIYFIHVIYSLCIYIYIYMYIYHICIIVYINVYKLLVLLVSWPYGNLHSSRYVSITYFMLSSSFCLFWLIFKRLFALFLIKKSSKFSLARQTQKSHIFVLKFLCFRRCGNIITEPFSCGL